MIAIEFHPPLSDRMCRFHVLPQQVTQTVNDRHAGVLSDSADRLVALRWFSPDVALLVDAVVTSTTPDLSGLRLNAVRPELAIWVQRRMPAGTLEQEMALQEVMSIIADSFGLSVSCHAERSPQPIYAGPWDGRQPRITGVSPGAEVFLAGSFFPDRGGCELVWAIDATRYATWFDEHLARVIDAQLGLTSAAFVRAQKEVLEGLLGVAWLKSRRGAELEHPAYQRWMACRDILAHGVAHVGQAELLLEMMADTHALVECTGGDRDRIVLGALANYGDDAVTRRLSQVLKHPTKFSDVLLELTCAASHASKGHEVTATESEGMPDLAITVPGWTLPVFAECKRLSASDGVRAVKNAITRANRQLRRANVTEDRAAGIGVVYLDASVRARGTDLSDQVPPSIVEVEMAVQELLRDCNRSISAVVVLWIQRSLMVHPHVPDRVLVVGVRKSRVLRHLRPHVPWPNDMEPLLIQQTISFRIEAKGSRTLDQG